MSMTDVSKKYEEPRAHVLRARYLRVFGGDEIPVPVESIAEDLLGLRIEESWDIDHSGALLPAERTIVLNAAERAERNTPALRRYRFTIAHELGHWICHVANAAQSQPKYCRAQDLSEDTDRTLEREANVFAAELLMPEPAVRTAWDDLGAPDELASRFDVSPSAMRWRLYSFGLVAEPPE